MNAERFATREELLQRIDTLRSRLAIWRGTDSEAIPRILEDVGFLKDSWPPEENRDLARDTCNRMAHLIMLFHHLGRDFDKLQTVLSAALALLEALVAGGEEVKTALARLHETAQSVARESRHAAAVTPDAAAPQLGEDAATSVEALFSGDKSFLTDFVSEAMEHLEDIDAGLLDLEKNRESLEALNGLFRSFHTMKGVADFLALEDISGLTHAVESLLDQLRDGELFCRAETLDLLFDATDLLRSLVASVATSVAEDRAPRKNPRVDALISLLGAACAERQGPAASDRPSRRAEEVTATEEEVGRADEAPGHPESPTEDAREVSAAWLTPTVKVDARRLDLLLDAIGELVVAVSVADQREKERNPSAEGFLRTEIGKLTRAVQQLGTSLRMIPLRSTFRKMMRQSRDLSRRCGKEVEFSYSGESTELDRTIVQKIQDPLIHILRNAIDHGLEPVAERRERSKPDVARVSARAYHEGGNLFVEVSDDGRGIDPDRVLRRAAAEGLIEEGQTLTRSETLNLIFEPGFSTADAVTNISGRGVGMDVVRQTVEELRGSVEIASFPGKGTTITMRLPLTVAMIEGMVIRLGTQRFIVPTLSLVRALTASEENIRTLSGRQEFLDIQDHLVPLVRMDEVLDIAGAERDVTRGVVILVEGKGRTVGLLVDEILGQQQIVIKGLGRALRSVPGIAGGAILADGRVGLILDVAGILDIIRDPATDHLKAVG